MFLTDPSLTLLVLPAIFVAAILYSSVGHGGASGYLAVMALAGLSTEFMKPTALSMNIIVTVLVFTRLYRAGEFDARLFLPFALASIPMAFMGGVIMPSDSSFKYFVGAALIAAAWRMFVGAREAENPKHPHWAKAAPIGAALGFISGLTGVGGGIYLSPLLLMFNWTTMRGSAAIASAFILLNSIAGLAGFMAAGGERPEHLPAFLAVAFMGAVIGSELGSRRMSIPGLRSMLAVVLIVAGAKMIGTA